MAKKDEVAQSTAESTTESKPELPEANNPLEETAAMAEKPKRIRNKSTVVTAVEVPDAVSATAKGESASVDVATPKQPKRRANKPVELIEASVELGEESATSTVEEPAEPESGDESPNVQKRRGFFSRLFGRGSAPTTEQEPGIQPSENTISTFGSSAGVSADVEDPPLDAPTDDLLDLSITRLKSMLADERRSVKEVEDKLSSLEADAAVKLELEVKLQEDGEKLRGWVDQISRSYYWKLQTALNSEVERAASDLERFKSAVEEIPEFEDGKLLRLRKKFNKAFGRALLFFVGTAAFAALLPWLSEAKPADWFAAIYNPYTSGPILITAVILVGVMGIVLRRFGNAQFFSVARIARWIFFSAAFAVLIYSSPSLKPRIDEYVIPFLKQHVIEIAVAWLLLFILVVAGNLLSYYRAWSGFRRSVTQEIARLEDVIAGYVHSQQELKRLEVLRTQTMEWMEILALALYRPWKTNPTWGQASEYTSHSDSFPFALRLAAALEGATANSAELERKITERLVVPGWRRDAFDDLVRAAGEGLSLDPRTFNVDLLDQDIPESPNNARAILRTLLKYNSSSSIDVQGDKQVADEQKLRAVGDSYLVEVARERLVRLIRETQTDVIATARPRVEQIGEDPLEELYSFAEEGFEVDKSESWDEFLTETVGTAVDEVNPLGALSFTDEGRRTRSNLNPRTYVVAPARLAKSLPSGGAEGVTIVPVGTDKPNPVELITRIDVVGPVAFENLTVMANIAAQTKESRAGMRKAIDDEDEEL